MAQKRKKRKLGSYPSFSVVGSMLLALLVFGLFGLFLSISNNLSILIRDNMEAQVYLMKEISDSQRIQVEKTLTSGDFILAKSGDQQIRFVSKEEAAEKFIKESGEDFFELLGDNPLRDSYLINIAYDYQTPEKLAELKSKIETVSGVFEFDYVESVYSKVSANTATISVVLISFASILFIAVVLLINNTIKLALFSQRFLIRSMQLVGAKSSFIRRPFLLRSMLHGIMAAALSCIGLYFLIDLGQSRYPDLSIIIDMKSVLIIFAGVIIVGALVGFTGTYLAIRKYLRMSLDELY